MVRCLVGFVARQCHLGSFPRIITCICNFNRTRRLVAADSRPIIPSPTLVCILVAMSCHWQSIQLLYTCFYAGCGAIYRTPGHTISPPMSGSGYKHNAKCTWMIMAPPGHVVQLAFSSFHLEDSNGCYFDSISVYDGYVNETVGADPTKPIGNFCGSTIPPLILSTGNVLSFIFKTDDSASGDGFAATYNFIDGKHSTWHNIFKVIFFNSYCCCSFFLSVFTVCGGKYFSAAGTLRSPNYPQRYPSNKDCTWVITADNGKQVELVVKHFELEGQSNCVFDSLEIRWVDAN